LSISGQGERACVRTNNGAAFYVIIRGSLAL